MICIKCNCDFTPSKVEQIQCAMCKPESHYKTAKAYSKTVGYVKKELKK